MTYDKIQKLLDNHRSAQQRVKQIQEALVRLDPAGGNTSSMLVELTCREGDFDRLAVTVGVSTTAARPFFEAALEREQATVAELSAKIDAVNSLLANDTTFAEVA